MVSAAHVSPRDLWSAKQKTSKAKQKYNLEFPKEVKCQQAKNATLSLGNWKYFVLCDTELSPENAASM